MPVSIICGHLIYRTYDRFHTYNVVYNPGDNASAKALTLGKIGSYEIAHFIRYVFVGARNYFSAPANKADTIQLIIPESNFAKLEAHLPGSGFNYVEGRILLPDGLAKAQIKYRGDNYYRWAWDKKSLRFKTSKKQLYNGMRSVNLLSPRSFEQLNNYLSYRLATVMGILAPRTDIVRLALNGEDRGVHILVEQIKEMTIRHAGLMPGDVYRGEIIGKDKFTGGGVHTLFERADVWDKVAINNHYDEDANVPMEKLLELVNTGNTENAQQQLDELLDMEAWGKFSAYESLTQSNHIDSNHNWRIYFDPWRGKFIPIAWDTMGWWRPLWKRKFDAEFITNPLTKMLFQNGNFIRARNNALADFFKTGMDKEFLDEVERALSIMNAEIRSDQFLLPTSDVRVSHYLDKLVLVIKRIFLELEKATELDQDSKELNGEFHYENSQLTISNAGHRSLSNLSLKFATPFNPDSKITVKVKSSNQWVDISSSTQLVGDSMVLKVDLLAEHRVITDSENTLQQTLALAPAYYQFRIDGIDEQNSLVTVQSRHLAEWYSLTPAVFTGTDQTAHAASSTYASLQYQTKSSPITWSGEIELSGVQTISKPLIIKPGTTIRMQPGAVLLLKNQLTAVGTKDDPIRFLRSGSKAWGSVILYGPDASGSVLSHCEMAGGSGYRSELLEYSAMFSIHDVGKISISDCLFRDSSIVDDMIHVVYSNIEFQRVTLRNAFSDALDLDISRAVITDSLFEDNGNDAIDLMTTHATVVNSALRDNGDKGISVGENSQLFAQNNLLTGNVFGIQSKDRSTAVLHNLSLVNNDVALHAYKKNWRYGDGGKIFASKLTISDQNIANVVAEKHSHIEVFDSYSDSPLESKRVTASLVNTSAKTASDQLFPENGRMKSEIDFVLKNVPRAIFEQSVRSRRGADIE